MKKIIMGVSMIFVIVTLVACSNGKSSEKESESTTENVTYPTKEFVEGSIQIETTTYESREGWVSEQETTDIKEVANTKELDFSRESGAIIKVTESIYAGDSNLSKYDIKASMSDGTEWNISFEGPSGLHGSGLFTFDSDYFFTINSETNDKKIQIGIVNFCGEGGATVDEYEDFKGILLTKLDEISDKDWLDLFSLKDSTYITETNEYIELLYENGDYANIGYSFLKWVFENPHYIVVDYYENIETYNDDNVILIYDSLKWN